MTVGGTSEGAAAVNIEHLEGNVPVKPLATRLELRVATADVKRWRTAATIAGYRSLAQWIRSQCDAATGNECDAAPETHVTGFARST